MKKNKIVITVEGGIIQNILADDNASIDILVLDYDCDGYDNAPKITDSSGNKANCNIWKALPYKDRALTKHYFQEYEKVKDSIVD